MVFNACLVSISHFNEEYIMIHHLLLNVHIQILLLCQFICSGIVKKLNFFAIE